MDVRKKLEILADAAKYDASCASSGARRKSLPGGLGSVEGMGICHSYTPDGRCVSLLKILLTNFCPDFTMEQLVEVARGLREVHHFQGYIHLKAVPGASRELIDKAGQYADRLSANIELPTDGDLRKLAPKKSFAVTGETMRGIRDRVEQARAEREESPQAPRFAPAGQSTQMIVGATPTPDAVILDTASTLYTRYKLKRVYYSAYSPIPSVDVRLPAKAPPLVREHRLYQADWLLRFYGFSVRELTPPEQPDLPLDMDPKLAWALRRREAFPVDVNRAPRELLLRVPGLGVRTVDRLLRIRRWHAVTLAALVRLRVPLGRAKPFIVTADHRPTLLLDKARLGEWVRPQPTQLSLFSTATVARTGRVAAVKPRLILCLGGTAAQAFLGPGFRLNHSRGQLFETPWAPGWMATFHPSALLRMPDAQAREEARRHFEADLRKVAEVLRK